MEVILLMVHHRCSLKDGLVDPWRLSFGQIWQRNHLLRCSRFSCYYCWRFVGYQILNLYLRLTIFVSHVISRVIVPFTFNFLFLFPVLACYLPWHFPFIFILRVIFIFDPLFVTIFLFTFLLIVIFGLIFGFTFVLIFGITFQLFIFLFLISVFTFIVIFLTFLCVFFLFTITWVFSFRPFWTILTGTCLRSILVRGVRSFFDHFL